jgi:glycosyltransferase involved in cell wall biosynthesis
MKGSRHMKRVALVAPSVTTSGGLASVTAFLQRVIGESEDYQADVISIAAYRHDTASTRVLSPTSWLREPRVVDGTWSGGPLRHVGARFVEIEFQRYLPRPVLTRLLDRYDLVQLVAGTPAWAMLLRDVRRPRCAFVATTIWNERATLIHRTHGWRKLWRLLMLHANRLIERRALSYVDWVLAESEYTQRSLLGMVEACRVVPGPPGVDTGFYEPKPGVQGGYILSVARFSDPRKNVRLLFRAYGRLREESPGVPPLVLAGKNGPTLTDWEYARKLGIYEHVTIHEGVTQQRLRELYQGASLFVLSSDEEGLGIVLLEAMACGLPVVSTDCGGPASAVTHGQTGYLTPTGDERALAARIRELLEHPVLRERMGRAGRRVAEQKFSLSAAGAVYLSKYAELLSPSREQTE